RVAAQQRRHQALRLVNSNTYSFLNLGTRWRAYFFQEVVSRNVRTGAEEHGTKPCIFSATEKFGSLRDVTLNAMPLRDQLRRHVQPEELMQSRRPQESLRLRQAKVRFPEVGSRQGISR